MNPLALLLIAAAALLVPASAAAGVHNGITLVAVLLVTGGITLQITHPTTLRARDLLPLVRAALRHQKAPKR